MRLICGLFRLDGAAASESLLHAMAAQMDVPRLRPRLTVWCDGPAGLAVIDFAAGGSAKLQQCGSSVLAADVRLDEPDALAQMLGREKGDPAEDLLLGAMQRFGTSGLERVLGDFAFAKWDRKAERLLCGRDIFGIRPLAYVHRPGELFAFASLTKALIGAGIVGKKLDTDALTRRVTRQLRHDDSLISGVKRLPPAHVIEISRDDALLKRYWQLDRAAAGRRQCSPRDAARELRCLLTEAVRCRLPRSGSAGTQLSGGLDSSAITVLAARLLRESGGRLHAYSFLDRSRHDIALDDGAEFIKSVIDQETDIDWSPIRQPAVSFFRDGSTRFDPENMLPLNADLPQNAACARAEVQGVGVILSGWGGDEGATFNARGALAELFLRGRWGVLAREISALGREWGLSRIRIFRGEVLSYLWRQFTPRASQPVVDRILGKPPGLRQLYLRSLSPIMRRRLARSFDEQLTMSADGRKNRIRLLTSPHIAERTEMHAQVGARHGLAFAFPLLDRRLVEFVLSLPSEFFVRDGVRRVLFRDAMADILPPKIRSQPAKLASFPGRMIDNLEDRNELLERIDAYEKNEIIRSVMDIAWLRRQVESFPTAERMREGLRAGKGPGIATNIAAVMRGLHTAAYLAQHGGEPAASDKVARRRHVATP